MCTPVSYVSMSDSCEVRLSIEVNVEKEGATQTVIGVTNFHLSSQRCFGRSPHCCDRFGFKSGYYNSNPCEFIYYLFSTS